MRGSSATQTVHVDFSNEHGFVRVLTAEFSQDIRSPIDLEEVILTAMFSNRVPITFGRPGSRPCFRSTTRSPLREPMLLAI